MKKFLTGLSTRKVLGASWELRDEEGNKRREDETGEKNVGPGR